MRKLLTSLDQRGGVVDFKNLRGVMHPPVKDITADGYDLQSGVNVLGTCFRLRLRPPFGTDTYLRRPLLPHNPPPPRAPGSN